MPPSRLSWRAFLQIHHSHGRNTFSSEEASNIPRRKQHIAPRFLAYPSKPRSRPQQIIPVSPRASSSSSSSWLAFEKPFFSIIEPVVAPPRRVALLHDFADSARLSSAQLSSAIARPARDLSRRARASRGMPLMPWTVSKWQPTQFELT